VIETLSKLGELVRTASFPLFLMAMHATDKIEIREQVFGIEDVPGDNFPYIPVSQRY